MRSWNEVIPPRVLEALLDYKHANRHPGDTLKAFLAGDVLTFLRRADKESKAATGAIFDWCYWALPSSAWKSPESVSAWLALAVTPTEVA